MGQIIRDEDHVVRYIGGKKIDQGRIQASAFFLKKDQKYLSVNWIEFFGQPNLADAVREIRGVFGRKEYKLGASARFAVLNVGEAKSFVLEGTEQIYRIFFTEEALSDDPSHAGINGITQENQMMIGEILSEAVQDTFSAR